MPSVGSELDVNSPMGQFYRGKVVFLTGATGVLGELFVEKLLRCVCVFAIKILA